MTHSTASASTATTSLERILDRARIRFVCSAIIIVGVILAITSFITAKDGRTPFGPPLGADFAGFYTAGQILNSSNPSDRDRLYDIACQDSLYHQLVPSLPDEQKLPFVHPPFVAWVFHWFARLPYAWAFALWLVFSASLYIGGFMIAWNALPKRSLSDFPTALLLAVAFEPFLMECWLGGQLSAIGLFTLGCVLWLHERQRHFAMGLVLGLLLYKPNLLILLLPMLIVSRSGRAMMGFGLTAFGLGLVSWWAAGWNNTIAFARALTGFASSVGGTGELSLRLWKYVDLKSFIQQLTGVPSLWAVAVALALAVFPVYFLGRAWLRYRLANEEKRRLVWAATVAATPLLNVYFGIYDTVLLIPAALIAAHVMTKGRTALAAGAPGFVLIGMLIYLGAWITQPIARLTGCQVLTLALLGSVAYALVLLKHWQGRADGASFIARRMTDYGERSNVSGIYPTRESPIHAA